MVLEEASADSPPQDFMGNVQPPGENGRQYRLEMENLPRPYTLVPVQIQKLHTQLTSRDTAQYLIHAGALLRRHPTQEEAEAAAYHMAERNANILNTVQLGHYWGLYRAWSTRKNFNWPIIDPYRKYPDFNPSKFLGFEGRRAILLRHAARVGVWGCWGIMLGQFISDAYSSTRAVRAMQADSRLQAIVQARNEELKKRAQAQAAGGPRPGPPVAPVTPAVSVQVTEDESYSYTSTPTAGVYGGEMQVPARQMDQWSTPRPGAEVSDDDASPTGGLGLWEDSNDSTPRGSSWDRLRRQSVSTASTGSTPKTKSSESSESDWSSQEASSQQPQQQGGAWERIRQQHQQGAPQQQQQQQKNDDDSWWK